MKKRLLAWLLAMALMVGLFPATALAEEPEMGYLSALEVYNGAAVYETEPAFAPGTDAYTATAPASPNGLYLKATLVEGAPEGSKIEAAYTNTSGKETTVALTSGTGKSLSGCLANNSLTGNTVTVTVGTEAAPQVYTLTIRRQATLKSLALAGADGTKYAISPNFAAGTTEYEAYFPAGQALTVDCAGAAADTVITVNGEASTELTPEWTAGSPAKTAVVTVKAAPPEETDAASSTYTVNLEEQPALEVVTPPEKTAYTAGEAADVSGMVVKAVYSDGEKTLAQGEYTISPENVVLNTTELTVSYHGASCAQPVTVSAPFQGEGTEEAPYLLNTAADLVKLSENVAGGERYAGKCFQMTEDLALPQDWTPLGTYTGQLADYTARIENPFSGIIDGKDHTLTIPAGEKTLIGVPLEAELRNLNIYGPSINGSGVVDVYTEGQKGFTAITIENVTLKSGTTTSGSGFVSGYAPGDYPVVIRNCTIEDGVTIGDGTGSHVGSFGGDFNGTIENCVSYATVKGVDFVGGILGSKGQSLATCVVRNCTFSGTVEAAGQYVGGIAGNGYGGTKWGFSNNAGCVTIENCLVTGSVTGATNVGGILGAEAGTIQCWDNGIGYVRNNLFAGTISATNANNGVSGGVIGYMKSLNRYNVIENNAYDEAAGKGIGKVDYVDTNCAEHAAAAGATYVNSEGKTNVVSGMSKENHHRTDDPLGADAEKLAKAASDEALKNGEILALLNRGEGSLGNWTQGPNHPVNDGAALTGLTASGTYKTAYTAGEALNLAGIVLTALRSDGSTEALALSDVTVSGYDKDRTGSQTVTIAYGPVRTEITVTVQTSEGPVESGIQVSFTLLGDRLHGAPSGASDTHTAKAGNLETWIARTDCTLDAGATVKTLFETVLRREGLTWSNPQGSYVQSITCQGVELGEFSNGPRSGWLYTVNGEYPDVAMDKLALKSGDDVVFHYTDDYPTDRGESAPNPSGSSGGGAAETPKTEVVIQPAAAVNAQGEAGASVSEKALGDAVAEVKAQNADVIVIAPEVRGGAAKVSVTLPKSGVDSVAKQTDAGVQVETGIASVTLPAESLRDLSGQSGKSVTVSAEALADAVKIEVALDGRAVAHLDGGITASVPAKTADSGTVLVIVRPDGTETIVKKSVADGKTVTGLVDGSCTVKTAANAKSFADTAGHWAADAAAFVSARELFQGVAADAFAPDATMSRAMLATVLYRLEDAAAAGGSAFSDVPAGAWYADAVAWAGGAGIVNGTGSGFDPDGNITREQLAVMLYRYAGTLGMSTAARGDLTRFADGGRTSPWARDAMAWAVGAGLITGKTGGAADPAGTATRAEVAVILQRMVARMVR